jgi:hypothetical protein
MSKITINGQREKWKKIANGEMKDDYTNHCLSHFGNIFFDYTPEKPSALDKEIGILRNSDMNRKANK